MKLRLINLLLMSMLVIGLFSTEAFGQWRRGRDRYRRAETVYCESGDGRRHWCREGIGRRVRLIRQRTNARCIQGRTWGVDRAGIWVDRGCRADFEVW
jgi:hypothetical protein